MSSRLPVLTPVDIPVVQTSPFASTPHQPPPASFSPDPLYSDQDLQAVPYGATDIDGDTILYTFAWYKNGVLQPYTTDTIPASEFYVGDEWSVTVTTDDGYDGGPSHTEAITVGNTAPTFTTPIALSTAEAEVGASIVCSASAEDLDDGVLSTSFEWTYNGSVVGSTDLLTVPHHGVGWRYSSMHRHRNGFKWCLHYRHHLRYGDQYCSNRSTTHHC